VELFNSNLFENVISYSAYTASTDSIMANNELERTWKEAATAQCYGSRWAEVTKKTTNIIPE
jgi:hypothetical protein